MRVPRGLHRVAPPTLRPHLGAPHRQGLSGGSAPLHPLRTEDADDRLPDRRALDPEDPRSPRPQCASAGQASACPGDPPSCRAGGELGRAGKLGVTSPPVAPRGEPSARRATLGASTTPQPDVRPFPSTDARDSSASPPSSHPQEAPTCRRHPLRPSRPRKEDPTGKNPTGKTLRVGGTRSFIACARNCCWPAARTRPRRKRP